VKILEKTLFWTKGHGSPFPPLESLTPSLLDTFANLTYSFVRFPLLQFRIRTRMDLKCAILVRAQSSAGRLLYCDHLSGYLDIWIVFTPE